MVYPTGFMKARRKDPLKMTGSRLVRKMSAVLAALE
jgi:hypothetical protein